MQSWENEEIRYWHGIRRFLYDNNIIPDSMSLEEQEEIYLCWHTGYTVHITPDYNSNNQIQRKMSLQERIAQRAEDMESAKKLGFQDVHPFIYKQVDYKGTHGSKKVDGLMRNPEGYNYKKANWDAAFIRFKGTSLK